VTLGHIGDATTDMQMGSLSELLPEGPWSDCALPPEECSLRRMAVSFRVSFAIGHWRSRVVATMRGSGRGGLLAVSRSRRASGTLKLVMLTLSRFVSDCSSISLLDDDLPPSPFFSADGEVERFGRVRVMKIVQVRLVEHVLPGLGSTINDIVIYFCRNEGCPRGECNNTVDESHVGVRDSVRESSIDKNRGIGHTVF